MTKHWKSRLAKLKQELPWKVYEIVWADACTHNGRYNSAADLAEQPAGSIVTTVGYKCAETKEFLRIAQSGSDYNGAWHPIDIPKAWVLSKRVLK